MTRRANECFLILLVLLLWPSGRLAAQTPDTPRTETPQAALHYLLSSQDAQAVAARQRVWGGPAALAQERLLAGRQGIPLTPQALQKPPGPPNMDAGQLYDELTRVLRHKRLQMPMALEPLTARYAYTPAQIRSVRLQLAHRPDVTRLLFLAAQKPQCVFVRDWAQGQEVRLPEYAYLRTGARLLRTQGYLQARDGQALGAVARDSLIFNVARHAGSDPLLVSYLVGLACHTYAVDGLADLLRMAGRKPGVAEAVKEATLGHRFQLPLSYALGGQAAVMLISIDKVRIGFSQSGLMFTHEGYVTDGPSESGTPLTTAERQFYKDFIALREADFLARMRRLIAVADKDDISRHDAFMQMLPAILAENAQTLSPAQQALRALSGPLPPPRGLTAVAVQIMIIHEREEVTAAAAALLAERERTGAFPSQLPSEFEDSFLPQPLTYRRVGTEGFIVSGVKPPDTETPIVFRYPAPKPKPVPVDMIDILMDNHEDEP